MLAAAFFSTLPQLHAQEQPTTDSSAKTAAQPAPSDPPADTTDSAPKETLEQRIARWAKVDWAKLVEQDQLAFLQQLRRKCAETLVDFTATFHKLSLIHI